MKDTISRFVMFGTGFLLWALTSTGPMFDRVREGWDTAVYWQIGVPLVLALQVAATMFSGEQAWRAPLWVIVGHAVAMLLIHPAGTGLGLLPLAIVFIGLPAYGLLFAVSLLARSLARLAQ